VGDICLNCGEIERELSSGIAIGSRDTRDLGLFGGGNGVDS
jgi:hypothetical protein